MHTMSVHKIKVTNLVTSPWTVYPFSRINLGTYILDQTYLHMYCFIVFYLSFKQWSSMGTLRSGGRGEWKWSVYSFTPVPLFFSSSHWATQTSLMYIKVSLKPRSLVRSEGEGYMFIIVAFGSFDVFHVDLY